MCLSFWKSFKIPLIFFFKFCYHVFLCYILGSWNLCLCTNFHDLYIGSISIILCFDGAKERENIDFDICMLIMLYDCTYFQNMDACNCIIVNASNFVHYSIICFWWFQREWKYLFILKKTLYVKFYIISA